MVAVTVTCGTIVKEPDMQVSIVVLPSVPMDGPSYVPVPLICPGIVDESTEESTEEEQSAVQLRRAEAASDTHDASGQSMADC